MTSPHRGGARHEVPAELIHDLRTPLGHIIGYTELLTEQAEAEGHDEYAVYLRKVRTAGDRGIAILEVSRSELDRLTGGILHQGLGLQVPPFAYEPFEDMLATALESPLPLLVAQATVTGPAFTPVSSTVIVASPPFSRTE